MYEETDREKVAEILRQASEVTLPGHMGLELVEIGEASAMSCTMVAS